jgi:hypothetical protein
MGFYRTLYYIVGALSSGFENGAFLIMRSEIDEPDIPRDIGLAVKILRSAEPKSSSNFNPLRLATIGFGYLRLNLFVVG